MHRRKDKINFLKEMLKGQRKVSELLPVKFSVTMDFGDGRKEHSYNGKKITEEEYSKLPKGRTYNVSFNLQ